MTTKVFISYSHQDSDHDWVQAFVDALREQDVEVWFDESNIKPGDKIADALESGLRSSDAVVAVMPSSPNPRPNIFFELGAALGTNKRLILVVDPSSSSSLPYDLRQRRWIALRTPEATAREVAEAINAPG